MTSVITRCADAPPAHLSTRVQQALDQGRLVGVVVLVARGGLLPSKMVAKMGRDQTKGHELPDAPGFGFGLGFSVLRDRMLAASPQSNGAWRWGGAYGHSWFVDRAQRLRVLAFTNTLYGGMSGRFVTDLRNVVYGALKVGQ